MSGKANPAVIGAFTLGAFAILCSALVFYGKGTFFGEKAEYVAYFDSALSGLDVGAPVEFRGVKVGEVTDIRVVMDRADNRLSTPVKFGIDLSRISVVGDVKTRATNVFRAQQYIKVMMERGLRARLKSMSLVTGKIMIELVFLPDSPLNLAEKEGPIPQMPTAPSPEELLHERLYSLPFNKLVERAIVALESFERIVASDEMADALRLFNATMDNSSRTMTTMDQQLILMVSELNETLREMRGLMESVETTLDSANLTMENVDNTLARADSAIDSGSVELINGVTNSLETARASMEQAEKTFAQLENVIHEDSQIHFETTKALRELSSAARAIKDMASYLERHPEAIIQGKR